MKNQSVEKIADLIESNNKDLSFILQKVKFIAKIHSAFVKLLPDNLQAYVQVANISHAKLILIIENSSIASLLRYQTPELLQKCAKIAELKHIQEIVCKVRGKGETKLVKKSESKMKLLSASVANIVKSTAEEITDPKLKEILLRISSYQEENDC